MNHPQDLYQEVRAGGDIKPFLLDLHRQNTGELPAIGLDLGEMPTLLTPAIPTPSIAPTLPPQFYVDQDDRQCLKLDNLMADTIDLVSEAVHRFCKYTGFYPDEIIPCPSRYILLTFGYFCPADGILIPFSRDFVFPIDYDVIVRQHG